MQTSGLELCNEHGVKTRLAKQRRQKDTTTRFHVGHRAPRHPMDTRGVHRVATTTPSKSVTHSSVLKDKELKPIRKWDGFWELIRSSLERHQDIEESICKALKEARTKVNVTQGDPTPDTHLLNLCASRLQALTRFRRSRATAHKIKLNKATAMAMKYSKQLYRHKWRRHCASFNARTGLGKAWRTYRRMNNNKRKSRNAAHNLVPRLKMTEAELAVKAGQIFFPHITATKQGGGKRSKNWATRPPKEPGMDESYNIGMLLEAIHPAKQGSAPGPGGITCTALSNLSDTVISGSTNQHPKSVVDVTSFSLVSWESKTCNIAPQEFTMQRGIDEVAEYLEEIGAIMILDQPEERGLAFIDERWGDPKECRFPLFNFLKPLPLHGMYFIHIVMLAGAFGMTTGTFFKHSCMAFVLPYWYIFLLEKSRWNNHSYLYGLITTLLSTTGAHRLWLILSEEQIDFYVVHWGGFLLDLTVGFVMATATIRPVGALFCILFNAMNSRMFTIVSFPKLLELGLVNSNQRVV
ncbi:hypothetical protein HPB47_012554 [Ixodes persulcatus]|uniref:Uncharacterized protein n=1 Tax=Ixodes persulcatus TaxID=34615 RepID=A0AC60NTA0_IXOPE|nr:hypothetical protein HPB47_012554 [Ixodes persulcatus]